MKAGWSHFKAFTLVSTVPGEEGGLGGPWPLKPGCPLRWVSPVALAWPKEGCWGLGVKRAAVGTEPQPWVQEREMELRRQALEEERRRREQVERRLQSESARRQQLVEKEVKMREKQFSQVSGWGVGWGCGGAWIAQGTRAGRWSLFSPGSFAQAGFYLGLAWPRGTGPTRVCSG